MKLVLSPHPDDAEYSMTGTILKNEDIQYFVVTLSGGGDNDETTGNDRLKEAEEFWLQFKNVKHTGLDKETIASIPEWQIVGELDTIMPMFDTVYVPPMDDNHFEHRKISEAARAATRGKAISLIEYYTPSTRSTWNANMFVDISDYLNTKINHLQKFKSQLERFYFLEKNVDIFHEDYFCRLRGLDKVEKFRVEYQFS